MCRVGCMRGGGGACVGVSGYCIACALLVPRRARGLGRGGPRACARAPLVVLCRSRAAGAFWARVRRGMHACTVAM